jgi:hypothetical protein
MNTERNCILETENNTKLDAIENEDYKKWTEKGNTKYIVNVDPDIEKVYVVGRGFAIGESETAVRLKLFNHVKLLSLALFVYMCVEHLGNIVVAAILKEFGMNITIIPVNGFAILQSDESYIFMIVMTVVKYLCTFMVFKNALRMPPSMSGLKMPTNKKNVFIYSFGIMLVTGAFLSFLGISVGNISTVDYIAMNYLNDRTLFSQNIALKSAVIFVWIILVSTMVEVLIHTSIFNALRQFGDYFAILFMSFISSIILQRASIAPTAFIVTTITGIAVVKTKSVYTGIIGRIIITSIMSICYMMRIGCGFDPNKKLEFAYVGIMLMVGTVILLLSGFFDLRKMKRYFVTERKNVFYLKEIISIYSESLPATAVIIICIALFVMGSVVSHNAGF